MRTSETRILTTHAGSLPRPPHLAELHGRRSRGEHVDSGELRTEVEAATAASIAAQLEAGIDIGNGGEQGRESFFTYVTHRMTGFGGESKRPLMADLAEHPDFLELFLARRAQGQVSLMNAPAAIGPVAYRDTSEVDEECRLVADAGYLETFMTAASPGIVASAMDNRHYESRELYLDAVAAALATEYRAITDHGLLLQIDGPDLALERHTLFADRPLAEFQEWVELVIRAINTSLAGIDPDRLKVFRQILVEFHSLNRVVDPDWRERATTALAHLTRHHQAVHVHGNNLSAIIVAGDLRVTESLEVTLVRRDAYRLVATEETFPGHFDRANSRVFPDFPLGTFRFGVPERKE